MKPDASQDVSAANLRWGSNRIWFFYKSQVEQMCSNNQTKVFDINVQMILEVLHLSQEKEKNK